MVQLGLAKGHAKEKEASDYGSNRLLLFRQCPGCGRRFHVKLEDRRVAHLEKQTVRTKTIVNPRRPGSYLGVSRLIDGRPMTVNVTEFQDHYRCGRCGYEWFEKHVEEHRESK